jgi:hypothetical protein
MTAPVRNGETKGFTEFSDWLRNNKPLQSKNGYIANNIDYKWENYNTGEWMLLEEKRKGAPVGRSQMGAFVRMDAAISDGNYKGFWVITFENTSPMDGHTSLKRIGTEIIYNPSPDGLTRFLSFNTWTPTVSMTDYKESIIADRYS